MKNIFKKENLRELLTILIFLAILIVLLNKELNK